MIKSNRGFTLIESLIGMGLLTILILISLSSIQQVNRLSQNVSTSESSDKQILQIIENVRSNMSSFKSTYVYYSEASANNLLTADRLAMAWDSKINTTVALCPTCRGRYGYVLQPYEQFRGLSILTLKISHESWGNVSKTYKFLVTPK